MAQESDRRHIRISPGSESSFRSPRAPRDQRSLPSRDRVAHASRLASELTSAVEKMRQAAREATDRAPTAEGHLITFEAAAGSLQKPSSLGDRKARAEVVRESDEQVVVHMRSGRSGYIERKLEAYATEDAGSGRPKHEPLVSALEDIHATTLEDLLLDPFDDAFDERGLYWVELWVRGGTNGADAALSVRESLEWIVALHDADEVLLDGAFRGVERDIYVARLLGATLESLPTILPAVYGVSPISSGLRDYYLMEGEAPGGRALTAEGPSDLTATRVTTLDTGVAHAHPLLGPSLRLAESALPGANEVDLAGHGTAMAGLAVFADLGAEIARGQVLVADSPLESIKIHAGPRSTPPHDPDFWAARTQEAVDIAESNDAASRRVFSISLGQPQRSTRRFPPHSWTLAVDRLAHGDGEGRLFCVAAGNVPEGRLSADPAVYPDLNLAERLSSPGPSENALTVGAVTRLDQLPASGPYAGASPVVAAGDASPFTTAGDAGRFPIKPDVVWEGGNLLAGAPSPIPADSLSVLTTGHEPLRGRPLAFSRATSAATASVAGMCARVWDENRDLRPESIRGLIVHSARWTEHMKEKVPRHADRRRLFGYGVPDEEVAKRCLTSAPTLIAESRLQPRRSENGAVVRPVQFIPLPLPTEALDSLGEAEIRLRVTLSYFAEPHESRRSRYWGVSLRWDLQGPLEDETDFRARINRLEREPGYENPGNPYDWVIGPDARSRSTIQSDEWVGPAVSLADSKMIAVFPALGWWDDDQSRHASEQAFSVIVTLDAGDVSVDLYTEIVNSISAVVET